MIEENLYDWDNKVISYDKKCDDCFGHGEFYSFVCMPAVIKCEKCNGKGYLNVAST